MAQPIVRIYPDLDAIAGAAAAIFASTVTHAVAEDHPAWIAVSGGATPPRLFETLSKPPWRDRIRWDSVWLCQVDERPVPPDSADSNYHLLKETLLERVPLPPGNVLRIRAELGAQAAAPEYEAELRLALTAGADGFPRLDLVLLGMGDDGHTASLFPHSPGLHETQRWAIANPVEKLGLERITLTYPVMNAAARVAFLVSGAAKAPALERVLHGDRDIEDLPAQGIHPVNGELQWLVDVAAAGA